jgi:ubiquinone biosynthesis monooxygenase Coq7
MRTLTPLDTLICQADAFLKGISGQAQNTGRPSPGRFLPDAVLTDAERQLAGRLMRVNHAGEVAAQGLYHGQMLTARRPDVRDRLDHAAREEGDHLHWCADRAAQLGVPVSLLNPFWYIGSFAIGTLAGLAGDRYSLGFIEETERQVESHLEDHLQRLPAQDQRSRAIVLQMQQEEVAHGAAAMALGGEPLPWPVRHLLMPTVATFMTETSYWL